MGQKRSRSPQQAIVYHTSVPLVSSRLLSVNIFRDHPNFVPNIIMGEKAFYSGDSFKSH